MRLERRSVREQLRPHTSHYKAKGKRARACTANKNVETRLANGGTELADERQRALTAEGRRWIIVYLEMIEDRPTDVSCLYCSLYAVSARSRCWAVEFRSVLLSFYEDARLVAVLVSTSTTRKHTRHCFCILRYDRLSGLDRAEDRPGEGTPRPGCPEQLYMEQ